MMAIRRTYLRPMDGWWRRDPFFIHYMAREATAIFVVIYAVILLVGVLRLAQGEASFDGWVASLRSETAIVLHALLLVAFVYHTYTWFSIMPKTMPPIVVAGKKLSAGTITGLGLAAAAVLSAGLFLAVKALAP
jgi:fumarate reductase subunit C